MGRVELRGGKQVSFCIFKRNPCSSNCPCSKGEQCALHREAAAGHALPAGVYEVLGLQEPNLSTLELHPSCSCGPRPNPLGSQAP